MRPRQQPRSPIVQFLGSDAGIGGPYALLGLGHSIRNDEEISRACQRRLRQIDCHPHRATPDADEVRLALYAAAKQLLDHELREQLAHRWPEGKALDMPKAWTTGVRKQRLSEAFVQRARMIIASSGGWNPVARKRLAHLARLNRVSAIEIIHAISPGQSTRTLSSTQQTDGTGEADVNTPMLQDRGQSLEYPRTSWWGAYLLLGALSLALTLTVMLEPPLLKNSAEQGDRQAASTATAPGRSVSTPGDRAQSADSPLRTELSHYTAIAHELDQIAARARIDPQASASRFKEIYPLFIRSWTQFPPASRERSARHIAEFIDRFGQSGGRDEQIAKLLAFPDRAPTHVMATAAVLDIILSTPGLPTQTRDVIWGVRDRVSTGSFQTSRSLDEAIAREAQELAARQGNDDADWWSSWLNGIDTVSADDTRLHARLLLDALSTRLRDTQTPGEGWGEIARLFVADLDWRPSGQARLWMISQLNDVSVPTARVAALTEALAESSSASGVDIRMVLKPNANNPQRALIAGQYQQAWFPESAARLSSTNPDQPGSDLYDEMRLAVGITAPRLDRATAIKQLSILARLNSAAWQQKYGEVAGAQSLILNSERVEPLTTSDTRPSLDPSGRDNDLAEEAINSRSATELQSVASQLISDNGPGVNTAHALVYLATRPADKDIRASARQLLVRFSTNPSVLIALDHALTTTRVTIRLDDLVRSVTKANLPERTSPDWMIRAHQAVLALLADGLGQGQAHETARVQSELARLYALRLKDTNGSHSSADVAQSAESLVVQLRIAIASHELADPLIQGELDSLSAVSKIRLARANTPIEIFSAYQRELVELRALLLEIEVSGIVPRIERVQAELDDRLDRAGTIFEQLAQTERALAELWMIELELKGGA